MESIKEASFPIPGYSFSGIKCGIKYSDKYDLGIIIADEPCIHSAMYTQNKVIAAPVSIDRSRKGNLIKAILVNSNNANACTGQKGYDDAIMLIEHIEGLLGYPSGSALISSTGVIGVHLPLEKMIKALPDLVSAASETNHKLFAMSMMTTDTKPKHVCFEFETSDGIKKIGAFVKGSGMISPSMATLLAYLVTDACVAQTDLDRIFKNLVARTFNAITIDGDMSTNDSAIILSKNGNDHIKGEDLHTFESALSIILEHCAVMLVRDGEGTTHCVKIEVKNAKSESDAKLCAKTIAESLLVKTAFFGKDPNWGRIACAVGYSGCDFDPGQLDIFIEDIQLLRNGEPLGFPKEEVISYMDREQYSICVDLHSGSCNWHYWTSDISYDYVKINAEYTT